MRPPLSTFWVVPGKKRRAVLARHSATYDRYYPVRGMYPPLAAGRDPFPNVSPTPLAYLPASDR